MRNHLNDIITSAENAQEAVEVLLATSSLDALDLDAAIPDPTPYDDSDLAPHGDSAHDNIFHSNLMNTAGAHSTTYSPTPDPLESPNIMFGESQGSGVGE